MLCKGNMTLCLWMFRPLQGTNSLIRKLYSSRSEQDNFVNQGPLSCRELFIHYSYCCVIPVIKFAKLNIAVVMLCSTEQILAKGFVFVCLKSLISQKKPVKQNSQIKFKIKTFLRILSAEKQKFCTLYSNTKYQQTCLTLCNF